MSETDRPVGAIAWTDLTVENAEQVRDFYAAVAGWQVEPAAMGEYQDFCMKPPGGEAVAGICHARGENAGLPPQWLIYITVADLQAAIDRALSLGGKVLHRRQGTDGKGGLAVIRDPAGAVAALYQTS